VSPNKNNYQRSNSKGEQFGVIAYVISNISKHRWRTVFTVIGIAVPIAFFILFAGIGDGLDQYIISESEQNVKDQKSYEQISQIVKAWTEVLVVVKAWTEVLVVIIAIMIVISIANTMLISTSGRRFEFGVLKALGLRQDQIINLVLLEAFIISALALIVGIILGVWGAIVFDYMFWQQGGAGSFFAPANVDMNSIILVSILTLVIGTITAVYPAIRVARLRTIDILRCE
jgi:ABC-type antimicrobial peptide transport system permease subunit